MEGVAVEGFGAEVDVGGAEFFGLTKEEVSARLKVEVQALE